MRSHLGKLAVLFLGTAFAPASAGVVTFENLPDQNFISAPAGGVNVGSFYVGVVFGPDVTGLSVSRFDGYADAAFPPHSGDVVVFSATSDSIVIQFLADQLFAGLYYTSLDPVTLTAFDALDGPLGSVNGDANSDGSAGSSDLLFLNVAGIRSVVLTGIAGQFTFDDVTNTPVNVPGVPEPPSLLLTGTAAVGFLFRAFLGRARSRGSQTNHGLDAVGPIARIIVH